MGLGDNMVYLLNEQKKLLGEIKMLRDLSSEINLREESCQLLCTQLNELYVMSGALNHKVSQMLTSVMLDMERARKQG